MTDKPTISTDGLRRMCAQQFWDTEATTDKPAYLLEGGQLHLIECINTRIEQGDDKFDIGIVDDPDWRIIDDYAFVIYIDDTPKKRSSNHD